MVRFDSVLAEFLGDDPTYAVLMEPFSITTEQLPLADDLSSDDPRSGLEHFPRHGDQFAVDAANPGLGGGDFIYGSGPVFRMVVSLSPNYTTGRNVIPGGASGRTDSPHFTDQAELWLANDTWQMRFELEDVLEGAVSRETYTP